MLRSDLYDYSDANIAVKGIITALIMLTEEAKS